MKDLRLLPVLPTLWDAAMATDLQQYTPDAGLGDEWQYAYKRDTCAIDLILFLVLAVQK